MTTDPISARLKAMGGLVTRFPLTVYALRCQWGDQTSREGVLWIERVVDTIARGKASLVMPAIAAMQSSLWLRFDDPR